MTSVYKHILSDDWLTATAIPCTSQAESTSDFIIISMALSGPMAPCMLTLNLYHQSLSTVGAETMTR